LFLHIGAHAQDGQNDPAFNSENTGFTSDIGVNGPNNNIRASVIQSDAKIIIGGQFTSYMGTAINRIARLNENGTLDATFNVGTGLNGSIRTIALQADGKILAGGDFGTYNGTTKSALVRINTDGTLDNTFISGQGPNVGSNGGVHKIIPLSNGKIVITGDFATFSATARSRIAIINSDGSLDTSFDPGTGANGTITSAAVQSDGKVVIGGLFTSYNGTTRNRIARLNSN